jgi:hypothetical protein
MALLHAPRYIISFWVMFCALIWSYSLVPAWRKPLTNRALTGMLVFWLLFQVTGSVLFIVHQTPVKETKVRLANATVDTAKRLNLQSVLLYGNSHFGFQGQILSMFSQNDIHFVATRNERYSPNAQTAESDPNYGFLCHQADAPLFQELLNGLETQYKEAAEGNGIFARDAEVGPGAVAQAGGEDRGRQTYGIG